MTKVIRFNGIEFVVSNWKRDKRDGRDCIVFKGIGNMLNRPIYEVILFEKPKYFEILGFEKRELKEIMKVLEKGKKEEKEDKKEVRKKRKRRRKK